VVDKMPKFFAQARARVWTLVAAGTGAFGLLVAIALAVGPSTAPTIEAVFRLTSQDGGVVDSEQLRGRPYAVFFGFARCPATCPTTLLEMSGLLRGLGAPAEGFKVYFITLDPERDTSAALADYVSAFGPAVVGLTGAPAQIAAAARSFGVCYRKVKTVGDDYVIEHGALVYLVDARGRVVDFLSFDESRNPGLARLAAFKLKALLENPPEENGANAIRKPQNCPFANAADAG